MPGTGPPALVARADGRAPVVLDPLSATIWRHIDGQATVAELAADLAHAGIAGPYDPLRIVATIVEALVAAGLVEPDPDGPDPAALALEPADRQLVAPLAVGGDRWILAGSHVGAPVRPPPGVGETVDTPPDAVCDLGPGWVITRPAHADTATDGPAGGRPAGAATTTNAAQWRAARWLTADGSHLVVPVAPVAPDGSSVHWVQERIDAISTVAAGADRAEAVVDLVAAARAGRAGDTLRAVAAAAPTIEGSATIAARLRGAHRPTVDDLLLGALAWAGPLLDLGSPDVVHESVKLGPGTLTPGRPLVWSRPRPGLDPEVVLARLGAVGLDPRAAAWIARAVAAGGRFAIGTDPGEGGGRKLYVASPSDRWWTDVRSSASTPDDAGPRQLEVWGPATGAGATPAYVAWKWRDGSTRIATYWETEDVDPTIVYGAHRRWAHALASFPIRSDPGSHLLLVESTGRRSLDLGLGGAETWGAALEPELRTLAEAAGLTGDDTRHLLTSTAARAIERVIGGLDGSGRPLATLYLAP